MTSWINSCRTAASDALVGCCSNVGSWFLACIFEAEKRERTVNKSYCHSYIFPSIKIAWIFSVFCFAIASVANIFRWKTERENFVIQLKLFEESGSHDALSVLRNVYFWLYTQDLWCLMHLFGHIRIRSNVSACASRKPLSRGLNDERSLKF